MHALEPAWDVVKREHERACTQAARAGRSTVTNDLNQMLRRLRQFEGEKEWPGVLLESLRRFVKQAAVFELTDDGRTAVLRGQAGFAFPDNTAVELVSARAFAAAYESRDPVVALRTPAEVGSSLAGTAGAGEEGAGRAHILPVVNGTHVAAMLFAADDDYVDANALELVAGVASVVLERQRSPQAKGIEAAAEGGRDKALPDWADLPQAEQNQHLAAQRFARVTVAEWQLAKPEACRTGRATNNLYLHLRAEIEAARENFQKRFMETPSMVDYLHVELVKTAAEGDAGRLGAEYPGPLV